MQCPSCDYDLRGTTSGACPECGRAFDPNDASTFKKTPSLMRRTIRVCGKSLMLVGIVATLISLMPCFGAGQGRPYLPGFGSILIADVLVVVGVERSSLQRKPIWIEYGLSEVYNLANYVTHRFANNVPGMSDLNLFYRRRFNCAPGAVFITWLFMGYSTLCVGWLIVRRTNHVNR